VPSLVERVADTLAGDPRRAAPAAALVSDLIVSSGGVSVGEEDHVKAAVRRLGALDLWRVASKPGQPLGFGTSAASRGWACPATRCRAS
jgi:molybdopterin molybdotransferase